MELIRTRADWRKLLGAREGITPEQSPCAWPVARIRNAIAREFPQFRGAAIRVIRRGHSLVVEVDRDWIFKFAWHPKANLAQEINILRRLKGQLGVAIPAPVFVSRDRRFFSYRRIPGRTPTPAVIRALAPSRRIALAQDLATLCVTVQHAIPRAGRARLLGRPRPAKAEEVGEVAATATRFAAIFAQSPHLVRASRRVFRHYLRRLQALTPNKSRFVGFDLQFDNLLVDKRGRLAGVLDWGYLTWSDAPGLFGLLYKDDPSLARQVMALASRRLRTPIPVPQAAAQGWGQVFSYLVEVSTNRWDMADRRREWLRIARRVP